MKIILIIFLTSAVVIFLMLLLNSATYNGASKIEDDSLKTSPNHNNKNDQK